MADPSTILAILQFIGAAAMAVCQAVDKAIELAEHEEKQALKELRKGVESLKSDTLVYNVLLNAIETDADLDTRSPYARFIQRQDGREAMKSLERALKDTKLLLEENPAGNRQEVAVNPSGSKKPRRALNFVLNVLKANFRPGHRQGLIGELKDATYEIFVCQQNNERAFKLAWNLYVVVQQSTGGRSSVDSIGNLQDPVGQALDSVLHAFRLHPFAVSPEGDSPVSLPTPAILDHNHDTATRHEQLARRIGKAWVDDRIRKYDTQVRDISALQTLLFELLWSGTVEQLKRDSPYSSDDPERPEFERAVDELEKALQEAIVRSKRQRSAIASKRQRVAIAFCGMVKAGKSLFLNALMGRAILPSDELPSTAWPCRIRHVEGQTVPELQFQAEPFVIALRKLQDHQYGRKMQTYQPPPEDMFEALISGAPSEPSEEEVLLRTIHSQWIDLHAATRDNLLKFETPGFKLPPMATGEQNVKSLLGQLNDIVRLCQRFDLKFDMSEVDWPLLTVEFNSLRGHKMDGIYEFIDLPGIGDGFRDFNFESLVRLVASDSNAIVPVVSFKEIPDSDWKRLPELVTNGFNGRANVVVCTHLDQVSQDNMGEQLKTVTKAFWPKGVLNTNRVIPCSSLMGLSARDLLGKSGMTKPPFETIWDKHVVGYHCAAKILGVGAPESTYDQFSIQTWKDQIQEELRASGLPGATHWLTEGMVDIARTNAFLREADTIVKLLQEMSNVQERKLLGPKWIDAEYDAAKKNYDQALEISQAVLDTWDRIESMQTQEIRFLLEQELEVVSQKTCGLINRTIKQSLLDCGLSLEDMDVSHGIRGASSGKRGSLGVQLENGGINDRLQESSSTEAGYSKVLITETKARAKDFLRLSERELNSVLETFEREYTAMILDLASTAKSKLLKVVRGMIKQAELRPRPEDWENRIGELATPSLNIDRLAFPEIRGVINSRQLSLLNRQYSIEMDTLHDRFKDEIINPLIRKLKAEGEKALLGATETSLLAAKELITSALLERKDRCKRELDDKENLVREERVPHLTAVYSNLVAAEGALKELLVRAEALQPL